MHELDLTGPAPQPKTLAEAQQIINWLWQSQQELLLRQRELQAQIEPLKEQLHSDSRDSSKPPSSDSPEQRAKRPKKPRSGKSQGAQPGHPKHERELVAVSQVDHIEPFYPEGGCACGGEIVIDEEPKVRHQVFDLPEVRYYVAR